jgi:hypothetical protein
VDATVVERNVAREGVEHTSTVLEPVVVPGIHGILRPLSHPVFSENGSVEFDSVDRQIHVFRDAAELVLEPDDEGVSSATAIRGVQDTVLIPNDSVAFQIAFAREAEESLPEPIDGTGTSVLNLRGAEDIGMADVAVLVEPVPGRGLVRPILRPVFSIRSGSDDPDTVSRQIIARRDTADAAPQPGDAAQRQILSSRTAFDSAGVTDSVFTEKVLAREGVDHTRSVEPSQSGILRSLVHPVFSERASEDSDLASRLLLLSRSSLDGAGESSDSVISFVIALRTASDALAVPSEDLAGARFFFRSASEVLAAPVTSALSGVLSGRETSDSAPAIDSTTRVLLAVRAAIDSVQTVSDDAGRDHAFISRTAQETLPQVTSDTTHLRTVVRSTSDLLPVLVLSSQRSTFHPRSAADEVPAPFDQSQRGPNDTHIVASRQGEETIPVPGTVATRAQVLSRDTADGAAAEDSVVAPALLVRTGSDAAPASDQFVQRALVMQRNVDDVLPGTYDNTSSLASLTRSASDAISAVESAERSLISRRQGFEWLDIGDGATRYALRVRIGFEAQAQEGGFGIELFGIDPFGGVGGVIPEVATRVVLAARTTSEEMSTGDSVAVVAALRVRSASDVLSSMVESAGRFLLALRTGVDAAPAADSPDSVRNRARSAADEAGVSDEAIRHTNKIRSGGEGLAAPAEHASRAVQMHRQIEETQEGGFGFGIDPFGIHPFGGVIIEVATRRTRAFRLSTDAVPVSGDQVATFSLRARLTTEWLDALSDWVDWRSTRPAPGYGPPVATITSVSHLRVGSPSCDTTMVSFAFDRQVDAWRVAVGSTHAFDGTTVAISTGVVGGFGRSFGRSFGRRQIREVGNGSAWVRAAHLLHGDNEVTVYGRANGQWSQRPVREPVGAG